MPSRGTNARKVRIDDELWDDADEACAAYGTDRAAVMRAALVALVAAHESLGDRTDVEVLVRVDLAPLAVAS